MQVEADRQRPAKPTDKQRHRGIRVQIWMRPEQIARLDDMAAITDSTRSGVVRDLIDGIKRPSMAGVKAAGELSRIGGLMKLYKIGTRAEVAEVLRIARELRAGLIRGDTDH